MSFLFYSCGAHPVLTGDGSYDELEPDKNYKEALQTHKEMLEKNSGVCIFPEGHIPPNGDLASLNCGLGYLADSTDAVVVPVSIKRERNKNNKMTVKIHYGRPLTNDKHIKLYKREVPGEKNEHLHISERIMDSVKDDLTLL